MEPLAVIRDRLNKIKPTLQSKYCITELGIFSSYVRGDQTSESDVDILVKFDPSYQLGLITYGQIESYISDCLGIRVDLVMKSALRPSIGERILEEVTYLWSVEVFDSSR